jgi:TRAP-type mannitol/chloroaromatic compound transport system permease large subunit
MTEFLIANMAPIIFVSMVLFLLVGFPVSFALAANGIFFALIGIELGLLGPQLFQALPDRIFGIMNNDTLLAIPFFTFMGLILERSGMAEDLLDTIGQLFGPLRGGLAFAVIFVGALLAATTGVVAASVISMGLISLPIMLRYGYDTKLATGVIAASGTLAQIIPPSLVLIIMADQLGKSVGDMYKPAPSCRAMVLTSFYVGYVALVAIVQAALGAGPARRSKNTARRQAAAARADHAAATPVPDLPRPRHDLSRHRHADRRWRDGGDRRPDHGPGAQAPDLEPAPKQAMETTAKLTTFVVFILVGARIFSLTFYGVDGHKWVEHLLTGLPGGEIGFLIVVNILVFLLAFFLDFFELSFIIVPLLGPVAQALGIDLIWFGILLAVNMQTSFMHPPFGFALFYLRSVAPASVKTTDIYWGAIPFVCIQIIMVGILIFFPQLVTFGLDKEVKVDLDSVQIDMPTSDYGEPSSRRGWTARKGRLLTPKTMPARPSATR